MQSLENDIEGHNKELAEREETIKEKDARIFELRKKNQELEKFKFVLDYKIKELQRQIAPKNQMAAKIREQIRDMDEELTEYKKSSKQLELKMTGMRLKGEGMKGEIVQQQNECATAEAVLRHIRGKLHELKKFTSVGDAAAGGAAPETSASSAVATKAGTKAPQHTRATLNFKQLKKRIAKVRPHCMPVQAAARARDALALARVMFGRPLSLCPRSPPLPPPPPLKLQELYILEGSSKRGMAAVDLQKEYNRQREYLEKAVETHKRKIKQDEESRRNTRARMVRESMELTSQINELRRQLTQVRASEQRRGIVDLEGGEDATFATQLPQQAAMTEQEALKEIEVAQQMLGRMAARQNELRRAAGPASDSRSTRR